MIKSLGGKYCDMVAMVPVVTLKSTQMSEVFMKVLKGDISFSVCAMLVEGHRTNKKFYKELCSGTIKPFWNNPFRLEDKIFPLFDTPHNFVCLQYILETCPL